MLLLLPPLVTLVLLVSSLLEMEGVAGVVESKDKKERRGGDKSEWRVGRE